MDGLQAAGKDIPSGIVFVYQKIRMLKSTSCLTGEPHATAKRMSRWKLKVIVSAGRLGGN